MRQSVIAVVVLSALCAGCATKGHTGSGDAPQTVAAAVATAPEYEHLAPTSSRLQIAPPSVAPSMSAPPKPPETRPPDGLCAENIRHLATGRQFLLSHSEEMKQSFDPDTVMRYVKAEAVYIPKTYKLGEVFGADSVRIDCRTMTRMADAGRAGGRR